MPPRPEAKRGPEVKKPVHRIRPSNWIARLRGAWRDPRPLVAIVVDAALIGSGFAMAAGAVGFAGLMVAESDHKPDVYGLKYLAIYAQPRKTAKAAGELAPSPEPPVAADIDMSPVGAIGAPAPTDEATAAAPTNVGGFSLVSAQPDVAWLREGSRIVAVRPGEMAPGIGRVVEILQREGRWFLIGDSGTALLSSDPPAAESRSRAPFSRQMIFGGGD